MSRYRARIQRVPIRALTGVVLTIAASSVAIGATTGPAVASPATGSRVTDGSVNYTFTVLDNRADPTFNQLLGINNAGLIAGYYGSGAPGHPN